MVATRYGRLTNPACQSEYAVAVEWGRRDVAINKRCSSRQRLALAVTPPYCVLHLPVGEPATVYLHKRGRNTERKRDEGNSSPPLLCGFAIVAHAITVYFYQLSLDEFC